MWRDFQNHGTLSLRNGGIHLIQILCCFFLFLELRFYRFKKRLQKIIPF